MAAILIGSIAHAQRGGSTPGAAAAAPASAGTQSGEADPGVRPVRLIDRDEIRVSRVELQPGAVRRVHAHDDVEYHVWTPVSGTLEITIGTEPPKPAKPGDAFFMKRGTPHGFRNVGTSPAAVFEIFVKKSTASASAGGADAAVAALVSELAKAPTHEDQ
jgi:quercetin dioxygenase-like cupin family protein